MLIVCMVMALLSNEVELTCCMVSLLIINAYDKTGVNLLSVD